MRCVCWAQLWFPIWKKAESRAGKEGNRVQRAVQNPKYTGIQEWLNRWGLLTWTDATVLDVYMVLNSPEKLNWDLLSDACFNTRGRGHEQSDQAEVQHQAEEMPLQRAGKPLRNFAARGCWAWGRITAFKKQLRRLKDERKFYHSL